MTAVVDLLFRAALYFYPKRFREHFSESMLETLAERLRERRRQGVVSLLTFVVVAWVNLEVTALSERVDQRRSCMHSRRSRSGMGTWLGVVLKEARFAFRSLRKRSSFTLAAIGSLAFGVGANTAIFSVVKGVLLTPLPYAESENLVSLLSWWSGSGSTLSTMSEPDLADIDSQATTIMRSGGLQHDEHDPHGARRARGDRGRARDPRDSRDLSRGAAFGSRSRLFRARSCGTFGGGSGTSREL